VVGLFGTYRILPGIWSADRFEQYEAERQACNYPFQNGGAHILARAVIRLARRWRGGRGPFQKADFPGRILFTVHDELIGQVREDLYEEAAVAVREEMERPHPELVGGCGVPRGIRVELKKTRAWGE
jgi:DNA polymerase I-like protein with 3'-5' exonuclease and polymerase domains